ncbi:Hypothetical protein D9617_21g097740 [Elsinoe fawcettii]|nr:Hypothetical protein D9617_21g097740 [Elsinoe fawcettii]
MTAVAAAIIAQIAITGYTLDGIADTHWVSRACMLFSLTAALMAVFYATTQQKILGRLATPKHIRSWIRGTIMTSDIDDPEEQLELCNAGGYPSEIITALQDMNRKATEIPDFGGGREVLRCIEALSGRHAEAIIAQCFTPSVASVITISAPQMLLSVSLLNLLLAVGVYIGFVWRSGLGSDLNSNDARNIFIVYIVSLGACSAVYSVSRLVTEDRRTPENIVLQLHYLAHVKKTIDAQSHRTQPDQATNRTSTQVTDRTTTIPEGAAHVT